MAFKELHKGLYEWGNSVLNEAISKGYIESAAGWKLKLPDFKRFKALESKIKSLSSNDWAIYREGKQEYLSLRNIEDYVVKNRQAYDFYLSRKSDVSNFFKLKGEYMRLSLNNPVQARSAHQLKLSLSLLFEWIEENNLINKILIDNAVHDEIVLECSTEYAELAKENLSRCMQEGGNYFLQNLTIKADANIGESWGKAK